MILGTVVGIDKCNDGVKRYRVLTSEVTAKAEKQFDWKFVCKMMTDKEIKASRADKWLNIKVEGEEIKGSSGALSRFEDTKHKPCVILSQLVSADGRLLGYKVASYDGSVKNIPIKEMLAYGNRITKNGGVPVQNAIFVPADGDKREYFKNYPGCQFLTEMLQNNKNKHTEQKRVQLQRNEKTLSRLEEIYNKAQLKELKAGKQAGVDIRIYANPALSAEQMHELLKGLQSKVNVKPIAHPEFDVMPMRYYIDCLKNGVDIRGFLNPKYDIGQISELSLAFELGLDISKMSNPKLKANEMAEIRERLERNIWKDELVKKDGTWI